jgi:hypothetical protein
MSNWGQGQQGFQYPQQTGFPGQGQFQQQPQQQQQQPQQGFQQGFQQQQQPLQAQRTGFPGQPSPGPGPGFGLGPQPTGFMGGGGLQPQQTGFMGNMGTPGFQQPLQAQPTGFAGGQNQMMMQQQQQQRRAPPPVPPMPSQFSQQNRMGGFGGGGGLAPQATGFPGMGGGLAPQQTGFPGGGMGGGMGGGLGPPASPLVPQMTGFIDPRLQLLSGQFMPTNLSNPYAGGSLQLPSMAQSGGMSLQQSFQQMNQETRGTAAPRVPWELNKGEKKSYDQIFRAWDSAGTGFIDGKTALEVFGQSGIDRNDLAKIWCVMILNRYELILIDYRALSDADNRGKLNLAEFHVAMGLIYRR